MKILTARIAAVAIPLLAAIAVPVSATSRICFRHIGEQDKQYPKFCFVDLRTTDKDVELSVPLMKSVHAIIKEERAATDLAAGTFRVTWLNDQSVTTSKDLGKAAVRRILACVKEGLLESDSPVPDFIDEVYRRIDD